MNIPLWVLLVWFVISLVFAFILGWLIGVFMTAANIVKDKSKE